MTYDKAIEAAILAYEKDSGAERHQTRGWIETAIQAAISAFLKEMEGEAVGWRKDYSDEFHKYQPEFCDDPQLAQMWRDHPSGFTVTPLFAAPPSLDKLKAERDEAVDWIGTVECPCTTFEQDETCPVGYPSLLCGACGGKGVVRAETVMALAAEMLKIADQVGEIEDPFAAWESVELLKTAESELSQARAELSALREGAVSVKREDIANIIDPHSFMPIGDLEAPFDDMVIQSRNVALRKADRIISAFASVSEPVAYAIADKDGVYGVRLSQDKLYSVPLYRSALSSDPAGDDLIRELVRALKPFSEEAACYDSDTGDGDDSVWATPAYFKIRNLRHARSALAKARDAGFGETP